MFQFLTASAKEGAAGAGEDQPLDLPPVLTPLEGLKQSRVLRVHGQDLRPPVPGLLLDQLPGTHQGLLIGQGNALPLPDGGHGGPQADHAHHRGDHRVGGGQLRRLHQALHAGGHPGLGVRQPDLQIGGGLLVHHHRQLRPELPDLLLHARYIGVGRQSPHCHAAGGNHLQ